MYDILGSRLCVNKSCLYIILFVYWVPYWIGNNVESGLKLRNTIATLCTRHYGTPS